MPSQCAPEVTICEPAGFVMLGDEVLPVRVLTRGTQQGRMTDYYGRRRDSVQVLVHYLVWPVPR